MRLVAFRKLWMSSAFEGVGDEASRVVIPIIAVSMLGAGALEVGMLNALGLSAFLVLSIPIGVWVDRLRRRRLMIAADALRALVVLSVPAAFVTGAMTIGQLLVCVALVSIADVVFTTAHGAFVPSVVHPEQVSDAHARLQSAASLAAVGSPSLTAALLSVLAAPFALVMAGISYSLSALTLTRLPGREDITPRPHDEGFWPAALAGLSFTIHHPVLRGLFLSGMLLNAATMFGSAATAVYALDILGLSPAVFALLGTFAAGGGLAASVAAPAILKHLGIGTTRILAGVACVPVVALTPLAAVLPWSPALWLGASTFGWAFLVVVIAVAGAGIVPRIAPAHRLGSVMASSRLFVLGIMPFASLAGGALASWIGVQPVLWIWAMLAGASVVPIIFSPLRTWRDFPADSDPASDAAGHAVTDGIGT
jgi:MFS family permease